MGIHHDTLVDMVKHQQNYENQGAVILNLGNLPDGSEPLNYICEKVLFLEYMDMSDQDPDTENTSMLSAFYARNIREKRPIFTGMESVALEDPDGFYSIQKQGESDIFTFCKNEMDIKQLLCAELQVLTIIEANVMMNTRPLLYFTVDPHGMVEHPKDSTESLYALFQYITQVATEFSHICALTRQDVKSRL